MGLFDTAKASPLRPVTREDGERMLINMDTVGAVMRCVQEHEGEHHHQPMLVLKLITGEDIHVLDDGAWGL